MLDESIVIKKGDYILTYYENLNAVNIVTNVTDTVFVCDDCVILDITGTSPSRDLNIPRSDILELIGDEEAYEKYKQENAEYFV